MILVRDRVARLQAELDVQIVLDHLDRAALREALGGAGPDDESDQQLDTELIQQQFGSPEQRAEFERRLQEVES